MIPLSDPEVPRRRTPYVNVGILAANVLVFLYTLTLQGSKQDVFFFEFGVIPWEFTNGEELTRYRIGREILAVASPFSWWATLFTSLFIHAGFAHILGNMVFLWVFGDNVEDRLGHIPYALFYVTCGLGATALHILFGPDSQIPTVGASGAIAGVLGAYLLFYPFHRINTLVVFVFITVIRVQAVLLIGLWVLLQVFSGIGSLGLTAQTGGVAYWAHVGGFLAGAGLVAAFRLLRGEPVWQPQGYSRDFWRWR